jgi:hypothetical protein
MAASFFVRQGKAKASGPGVFDVVNAPIVIVLLGL